MMRAMPNGRRSTRGGRRGVIAVTVAVIAVAVITVTPALVQAGERPVPARQHTAWQQRQGDQGSTGSARRAAPPRVRRPATAPAGNRRRPALLHTAPTSELALAADLSTFLRARTSTGSWGALVVSLTRGDTLFAEAADVPLVPASTMKTFTAALAFDRLGADYTFSTDVLRDGSLGPDGTVHGNLYLRGDGDPGLSAKFVSGGPSAPMDALARAVAASGVRTVSGDLVADASALEGRGIPEGWLTRYEGAAYAAPFSALSLNENVVIVGVYPQGNGRAAVRLEPASSTLTVTSTARTVAGRGVRLSVRMAGTSNVVVSGTIGARAQPHRVLLVVKDPAMFTAGAFRAALQAHGVTVRGAVRMGRTPLDGAVAVTALPSPPLSRLVSVMNRESVNVHAEQLYRNAARGRDKLGDGSAAYAATQLGRFVEEKLRLPSSHVMATDGSGLSVLNRVTARSLVHLMGYAHEAPWRSAFHASLPVAGESETLKARMRDTPASGNLHAKTGTTNEVISLAGYVTAANGELLAFAFLYNGNERWDAREVIDAIGPTLAAFSR